MTSPLPKVVLASTSPYRRTLLSRILSRFDVVAPDVDEMSHDGETPAMLAMRLAESKAVDGATQRPGRLSIGADQVAALGSRVLSKPGHRAAAAEQLRACSGQAVHFFTGACVATAQGPVSTHTDITVVNFRELTDAEIERYLDLDAPYDCAGSFKCEAAGISLFESMQCEDPTGIVGLPLIWTSAALRSCGLPVP